MHLLEPIKIGTIELPNRFIMAPVKTGYGTPSGEVTYRNEAYFKRRAAGGVGAIIVEPLFINPIGKEHPKQLGISSFQHIKGLKKLVHVIHEEGSLAIAHLNHAGRAANPKASGLEPEAPSAVQCPTTGATPKEMTIERIHEVVKEYTGAARRAIEADFDGIEIQFGLGYLIAQFMSPHTNLRKDKYDISNKFRFASEVLTAIFKEVGNDYPFIARMSALEQSPDGMNFQDALNLAKFLEEHGISALHIASGSACDSPPWYYQHMRLPLGKNLEWSKEIKKEVNIPVIAVGRLGKPADIRNAIEQSIVDAIALGRPLVADPDLPQKMIDNKDDDIIQCGACLQGCLMKVKSGEGLGCIVNPQVGKEAERQEKPSRVKKIVVVGGGPAGMEAALLASEQGHQVVLFDKFNLGGQFNLSYLPPGKEMMLRPLSSLIHKVKNSSIILRLAEEVTVKNITVENPDVVIIATGATPIIPPIPGLDNAYTGEDILTERKTIGKNVLIIGGGMVGLECAEFLAQRNHQVTIVELLKEIARDMDPISKKLTLGSLEKSHVKILTETKIIRFENNRAFAEYEGKEQMLGEFDNVVVAVGTRSINNLEPLLQDKDIDIIVIGDAKKPRQIYDAVHDGFETASRI